MDGANLNPLAGLMPQGNVAPVGNMNPAQNLASPAQGAGAPVNNAAQPDANTMGALNQNDINLALIMMQQQQQQQQQQLQLQMALASQNQGMANNPMANQMGMMNMGLMGAQGLNNPAGTNAPAAANTAAAPAGANNATAPAPAPANNTDDMLMQLMQSPMALQMMAMGMNPLMLLGMDANAAALNSMALLAFQHSLSAPQVPAAAAPKPQQDGDLKGAAAAGGKGKKGKRGKVKGKPKRPLSAYNFFFREERARILDSLPKGDKRKKGKRGSAKEDAKTEGDAKKEEDKKDGDAKEESGEQGKDYDCVGDDGRKIPHGKIGFESLAKMIGKRWKELTPEELAKYKEMADEDMKRYKKEMEDFLTREAQAVDGDLMAAPASLYAEGPKAKKAKKEVGDVEV